MNPDFFRLWTQTFQTMLVNAQVGPFTRENTTQLFIEALAHTEESRPAILQSVPVFQGLLNIAASVYSDEKDLQSLNIRDAREELKSALKQAERLQEKLVSLSHDAQCLLEKTPLDHRKKLMTHPFQHSDRFYSLTQILESHALVTASLRSAFGSTARSGNVPDNHLSGIILCCYLFWTKVLKEEFKMDWTKVDVTPLTPAAEWCLKVCQKVDSDIDAKHVRTAVNKMKRFENDFNNLSEVPHYILSFLKHFQLLR